MSNGASIQEVREGFRAIIVSLNEELRSAIYADAERAKQLHELGTALLEGSHNSDANEGMGLLAQLIDDLEAAVIPIGEIVNKFERFIRIL
jgi:hypothetical protein